jgi:hypothetical protein
MILIITGIGSSVVTYGVSTVGGRSAFGVNWDGVGYFSNGVDKLNQFQLVLIDRSDVSAGDFDVQFNYGNILWETGTASGGTNGYGGTSAAAGYSNGATGEALAYLQVPGSMVPGSFILGGPYDLTDSHIYFEVRNGAASEITPIPEPTTSLPLLILIALPTVFARSRRR